MFPLPKEIGSLEEIQQAASSFVPGTRAAELTELDSFYAGLKGNLKNRVFGIIGPPGIGKTALLQHICVQGGLGSAPSSTEDQVRVGAAHFFKYGDSDASRNCFLSIANQLSKQIPGLEQALARVEVEGIEDPKVVFRTVLCAPLQHSSKPPTEMVVVLDALDESDEAGGLLLEILNELWDTEMPNWLGLVFSSRVDQGISKSVRLLRMEYQSESNQNDVKEFLSKRMQQVMKDEEELDKAVNFIAEHAQGFFLYADVVSKCLSERGESNSFASLDVRTHLDDCIAPLNDAYASYLERYLKGPLGGDVDVYQSILSVFAVARSALSCETVVSLLEEEKIDQAMFFARASVLFVFSEESMQLPHTTIAKFLTTKPNARKKAGKELKVSAKLGHDKIASILQSNRRSQYSLRHLVYHLCELKEYEDVEKYLLDFDWLFALVELPGAASQLIDDLDAFYNYRDFANPYVTDVVRTLDMSLETIETEPSSLAFQLFGRITDPSHPILASYKASEFRKNASCKNTFLPRFAFLDHARSALRKIIREHMQVALDGDTVLLGAESGVIELRDIRTWRLVRIMEGHCASVTCLALEDTSVVSGSEDGTLWVRERRTGACVRVLETRTGWICSVAIEGNTVVSGAEDEFVRVWDSLTGECTFKLEGHQDWVLGVAISGDIVVSGSFDKTVRVWNANSGELLHVLEGHTASVTAVDIVGDSIVSGSQDKTVRVWDRETGTCQHTFQMESQVRVVSVSAEKIAAGGFDNFVKVWDRHTGALLHRFDTKSPVKSVALEDNTLLVGCKNKTVLYLDIEDAALNEKEEEQQMSDAETSSDDDSGKATKDVAICRGTIISMSDSSNCARLWDAETGACLHVLKGHTEKITAVAINETVCATGSEDNRVRVWDIASGNCLFVLEELTKSVTAVALSDDILVASSTDETVKVWSVKDGSCLASFQPKSCIVALATDGHVIVGHTGSSCSSWDCTGNFIKEYSDSYRHRRSHGVNVEVQGSNVFIISNDGLSIYDIYSGEMKSRNQDYSSVSSFALVDDSAFVSISSNSLVLWKKDNATENSLVYNIEGCIAELDSPKPTALSISCKDGVFLLAIAGSPVPRVLFHSR